ncbi:MAG: EamA family transporter [Pseudomonadota bacterium]
MHLVSRLERSVPPHAWFGVSAVFHYLGPSFAVLLFPSIGVLGVAWLRIASAAAFFALIGRPLQAFRDADRSARWLMIGLGFCLAIMNSAFYLALDRLPMSLVAAVEFVGTIALALIGVRSWRNAAALLLAAIGVGLLIEVVWSDDPLGLFWAFLNGGLFVGYIALGHRLSRLGGPGAVDRLGAAMIIAFLAVLPVGIAQAMVAFSSPVLLGAAVGVGVCSSVIPYLCDQKAMARLPRASFALLLALLPALATLIGAVVLSQIPSVRDGVGILLVMAGVALHKPAGR